MPLWRLSDQGGESDSIVRWLKILATVLGVTLPLAGGILLWLHEASQAHAGEHVQMESRQELGEANHAKVMEKLDNIDRDIRSIMIKVGAERAAREALHNQR